MEQEIPMTKPTNDPVLEALKLGRQYVAGVEGTIPIKPNICTPDREKIERAIAIQEAQMKIIEALREEADGPDGLSVPLAEALAALDRLKGEK